MSNLIKCKSCDTEISKNAKICPQCGEPNKKKSFLFILFIFIIVLISLLIGIGTLQTKGGTKQVKLNAKTDNCYDYNDKNIERLFSEVFKEKVRVYGTQSQKKDMSSKTGGVFNFVKFNNNKQGVVFYDNECNIIKIKDWYNQTMYDVN